MDGKSSQNDHWTFSIGITVVLGGKHESSSVHLGVAQSHLKTY